MNTSKNASSIVRGLGFAAIAVASMGLLGGIVATSSKPAEARPSYGADIGLNPGDCTFCHVGRQASKQFTNDGYLYAQGLVRKGLLTQAVMNTLTKVQAQPAAPRCTQQTVALFDMQGNFKQNYTHCVP